MKSDSAKPLTVFLFIHNLSPERTTDKNTGNSLTDRVWSDHNEREKLIRHVVLAVYMKSSEAFENQNADHYCCVRNRQKLKSLIG